MNETEIKTALKEFDPIEAAIAEMGKYTALVIKGIDDKEGYKAVHDARMVVKSKRVEVEKRRKALKEDALKFGRAVDTKANEIKELLRPIEDDLSEKEAEVDQEKQRIKEQKEREEQDKLQKRVDMLAEFGSQTDIRLLKLLSEKEFVKVLGEAKLEHEARIAKEKEEEAAKKAEAERLEKQRIEQDKVEAAQRAEREKLLEEAQKIAAEKKAIEDAKQKVIDDKAKAKEIEAAKKKAVADHKTATELAAKKAEELKLKKAALLPDKAKLFKIIDDIGKISWPELKSEEARAIMRNVAEQARQMMVYIKKETEKL